MNVSGYDPINNTGGCSTTNGTQGTYITTTTDRTPMTPVGTLAQNERGQWFRWSGAQWVPHAVTQPASDEQARRAASKRVHVYEPSPLLGTGLCLHCGLSSGARCHASVPVTNTKRPDAPLQPGIMVVFIKGKHKDAVAQIRRVDVSVDGPGMSEEYECVYTRSVRGVENVVTVTAHRDMFRVAETPPRFKTAEEALAWLDARS